MAKDQTSPAAALADKQKIKSENFKRLAEKRVGITLMKLEGIKQLSNRNSYSYDEVQVKKILNALKSSINDIEVAFTQPSKAAVKSAFTL